MIKKIKILSIFTTFLLCFPLHFLYDLLPNSLFSIFVPVNESIWEHMKLIYTSFLLSGFIEYILLKRKVNFNNFLWQLFLVPIIGIIIYLVIFIPIYNRIGENMIISISLLLLVIFIEELLSYFILNYKEIKYQFISVIGIIICYIIFGYLTYNPIQNYLFYDIKNEKYGLNIYTRKMKNKFFIRKP